MSALAAEISGVRLGETSATATRIVFDLSEAVEYELAAIPNDAGGLVVTLKSTAAPGGPFRAGRGRGHVARYASSANGNEIAYTFAFSRTARVAESFIIPASPANANTRLVIDLTTGTMAELLGSAPPKFASLTEVIEAATTPAAVAPAPAKPAASDPIPAPASASAASIPSPVETAAAPGLEQPRPVAPAADPVPEKPIVVIDPGHGGSDPGAIGQNGTREAVVIFAAAQALAKALEERGTYIVVLTRGGDNRLAHAERSEIARGAKADLFISLHADAHEDPDVRGGSVYTLSAEGTARSAKEAQAGGDYVVFDLNLGSTAPGVSNILYNLAQRKTGTESEKFAQSLISKLTGVTPLVNNSHRRDNFKVLLAPDVPAVLLELAFISNAKDEANLRSEAWRKKTAGAIADAIDAYFAENAPVRHAANRSAGSN